MWLICTDSIAIVARCMMIIIFLYDNVALCFMSNPPKSQIYYNFLFYVNVLLCRMLSRLKQLLPPTSSVMWLFAHQSLYWSNSSQEMLLQHRKTWIGASWLVTICTSQKPLWTPHKHLLELLDTHEALIRKDTQLLWTMGVRQFPSTCTSFERLVRFPT